MFPENYNLGFTVFVGGTLVGIALSPLIVMNESKNDDGVKSNRVILDLWEEYKRAEKENDKKYIGGLKQ